MVIYVAMCFGINIFFNLYNACATNLHLTYFLRKKFKSIACLVGSVMGVLLSGRSLKKFENNMRSNIEHLSML